MVSRSCIYNFVHGFIAVFDAWDVHGFIAVFFIGLLC